MHQFVEYIIGGAMLVSGVQSATPVMPVVMGAAIVIHTASTKGPFSAFRLIHRSLHRMIDPVLVGLTVVAALQPWVRVDSNAKVIMFLVAVVHLFVWWQSSFTERVKRPPAVAAGSGRSEEFGRMAGRVAAAGVRKWRDR
jgi:hypothetical protein